VGKEKELAEVPSVPKDSSTVRYSTAEAVPGRRQADAARATSRAASAPERRSDRRLAPRSEFDPADDAFAWLLT
jgi:hypothetical protein